MRLIVGGVVTSDQPDDAAVHDAIHSLVYRDDDAFAILIGGPDPETSEYYIQALYCPLDLLWGIDPYGFVLEYREGSSDQHYQSCTVPLGSEGLEEVTRAFVAYLHGDSMWKNRFEWENSPGF